MGKGKELEDDIDLDEEIKIPKWDIHNIYIAKCMNLVKFFRRRLNNINSERREIKSIKS